MRAECLIGEKEFRDFTVFDILRRRKMWKSPAIFALLMSVSALICFLFHSIDGSIMLGTVLLAVGLGVPAVYFTTFFSSLRKQTRNQKLNPPKHAYTIVFADEDAGINASNQKEKTVLKWKDIHHAYRAKDAVYLYYSEYKAFIIPSSSLKDSSIDELWTLFGKRIPPEKLTLL